MKTQASLSPSCGFRNSSATFPGAPKVFSSAPRCPQTYLNHSHRTSVPVIGDPSYSDARPECPPRVWYSPEIDASKYTLHILSDTPGGFQRLKYILLVKYYTNVSPTARTLFSAVYRADCFRKLRLFGMWKKGMYIHPEDETSYTSQYQAECIQYVENEYCSKHRRVPVITPDRVPGYNLLPSATTSGSGLSL